MAKKGKGWVNESKRHALSAQGIPQPNTTKSNTTNSISSASILDSLFSPDNKNVLKHGKLEKIFFDKMKDDSKRMDKLVSEATETLSTADKLAEDTFYSLYKNFPEINDKQEINEGYRMNYDIVNEMMSLKEFEEMRIRTRGNELQSAMSTVYFLQNMIKNLSDEDIQKANDLQNEINKKTDEARKLQKSIGGLKDNSSKKAQEKVEEMKEQLEKLKSELSQKSKELEDELELNNSLIRNMARASIDDAKEQTDALENVMTGWGVGSSLDDANKISWKDKVELAEALQRNKKIIEMSKMIGQMKRLAISVQKKKVHKVPEFIEEIEMGNDINRVLPDELAYLGKEELKPIFLKKYSERQLLQYKMKGHEKQGKGSMVVCVDTSGSMSGLKETWAKSVALALYNVARRQKRAYKGINFSARGQHKVYSISTENGLLSGFKRDGVTDRHVSTEVSTEQSVSLIEFLEDSFGSGTDFDTPLKVASEIISSEKEFKKADMVFITDGIAEASQDVLEEIDEIKSKKDFQIIGIALDTSPGGLRKFCDSIFELEDILKDGKDVAQNIFELV